MDYYQQSTETTDTYNYATTQNKYLNYIVLQVTLKEKFFGTGSKNIDELEKIINDQVEMGYRLHTITTTNSGSKGFFGGDRIHATLVFERYI